MGIVAIPNLIIETITLEHESNRSGINKRQRDATVSLRRIRYDAAIIQDVEANVWVDNSYLIEPHLQFILGVLLAVLSEIIGEMGSDVAVQGGFGC
jgi:hypothetical protein